MLALIDALAVAVLLQRAGKGQQEAVAADQRRPRRER
jgi:hypothetical protein